MKRLFLLSTSLLILAASAVQAQDSNTIQSEASNSEKLTNQAAASALSVYTKWRDESLRNYPQGANTPHLALAAVTQQLDDRTAQVEILLAADMKRYTISVKPLTLARQTSGEYLPTPAGRAVTIDRKAVRKLAQGSDAIRVGEMTTIVPVTRTTQALEITWTPKNDNDGQASVSVVQLRKEPTVTVNGYILSDPIK